MRKNKYYLYNRIDTHLSHSTYKTQMVTSQYVIKNQKTPNFRRFVLGVRI